MMNEMHLESKEIILLRIHVSGSPFYGLKYKNKDMAKLAK